MTFEDRLERLDRHIRGGTLLRIGWGDGVENASPLVALAPECADEQEAEACPADVMPLWMAQWVAEGDIRGSDVAWPWMAASFASSARRWSVLTPDDWERVRYRWLAESVLKIADSRAVSLAREQRAVRAVYTVRALCRRAARGDIPTQREWEEAREVALVAWRTEEDAAARWAAWTAVRATTREAWAAAWGAAMAVWPLTEAGPNLAAQAAWDEMAAALLATIGEECVAAERRGGAA